MDWCEQNLDLLQMVVEHGVWELDEYQRERLFAAESPFAKYKRPFGRWEIYLEEDCRFLLYCLNG